MVMMTISYIGKSSPKDGRWPGFVETTGLRSYAARSQNHAARRPFLVELRSEIQ